MAFDPQYAVNRQFYVDYTNTAGNIVITRYLRAATNANLADFSSATQLLTVAHPTFSNHNDGILAFGPDACLYAGVGDDDPNNNGQNQYSSLENSFASIPTQRVPAVMSSLIRSSSVAARSKFGVLA